MKVGFFTYGIYGERMTGIARYAVELTRALRKLEPPLEIVLLNPYAESEHPWYREFPTHPLPHLKKLPFAATLGNWELHRAAKYLRLDVLHDPCGIAPFLAPRGRYRKVTTIHDAVPAVYPETQQLLTRMVFAVLVARAGATSDAILTVSQSAAGDLIRHYRMPSCKVYVTPNGVHPPQPLPDDRVQEVLGRLGVRQPFFLYVGALHPRKNLQRVLESFAKVRLARPQATLVIVGPPSWGGHQVLQDVLRSAETENGVTFTGFLTDGNLSALYQGAHGLVFPSLYEGFGLPALEAMSYGTPVITSNVSSLPEVVGDAALLVDPTSVEAISQGMLRLLEDEALREELSRKGQFRSREYTWEATAAKTLEVYRDLVSRTRARGGS